VSELQRGPDISVTFEVWLRIKWSDGTVKDWHPLFDAEHDTLEAARENVAVLPTVLHPSLHGQGASVQYRIRQAITILEWLE
jgi:hypothetical protein